MYSYTGIKIFQKGEAEGDFSSHQLSKLATLNFIICKIHVHVNNMKIGNHCKSHIQ